MDVSLYWLYTPKSHAIKTWVTCNICGHSTRWRENCGPNNTIWSCYRMSMVRIDPSHKSHNASDKYPIMRHFATEMCTHVRISVTEWCIVGYGTGASWYFWYMSISPGCIDIIVLQTELLIYSTVGLSYRTYKRCVLFCVLQYSVHNTCKCTWPE